VRLIGVDTTLRDRLTGALRTTSTNLLTGERIVTVVSADGARTERRARVAARRVPLAAVDHADW
jgi:hypothetical protein